VPFTPFHFGPGFLVGLPISRKIDLAAFLLANVVIDLEPLSVMVFKWDYPLHGYFHTILLSPVVAGITFLICTLLKRPILAVMNWLRLSSCCSRSNIYLSALTGAWLHVLLDAPLYHDIKPFYPFQTNPLLGIASSETIYAFCSVCIAISIGYLLLLNRQKN